MGLHSQLFSRTSSSARVVTQLTQAQSVAPWSIFTACPRDKQAQLRHSFKGGDILLQGRFCAQPSRQRCWNQLLTEPRHFRLPDISRWTPPTTNASVMLGGKCISCGPKRNFDLALNCTKKKLCSPSGGPVAWNHILRIIKENAANRSLANPRNSQRLAVQSGHCAIPN